LYDPLTIIATSQGLRGTIVITNSGAAVVYTPAPGLFGVDHFTYTVSDGDAGLATGLVTVTIASLVPPIANFALNANPDSLIANGAAQSTLTVTATDAMGDGTPFAGKLVTLTWNLGHYSTPVTVTLDSNGVATYAYTAGLITGTDTITATIDDMGVSKVATTTITLERNPLSGELSANMLGKLITYTFIVRSVDPSDPQTNLVLTGSVPANTVLLAVTGGYSVTVGGDYGQGYVSSPVIAELLPDQSYTLTWTIKTITLADDVETKAHAVSDTSVLELSLANRIYRYLLMLVYKNYP